MRLRLREEDRAERRRADRKKRKICQGAGRGQPMSKERVSECLDQMGEGIDLNDPAQPPGDHAGGIKNRSQKRHHSEPQNDNLGDIPQEDVQAGEEASEPVCDHNLHHDQPATTGIQAAEKWPRQDR